MHSRLCQPPSRGVAGSRGCHRSRNHDDLGRRAAPSPRRMRPSPRKKSSKGAAAKVREGKLDEALRLIKEVAAKHPEWPPSQLILARLLVQRQSARSRPPCARAGRRRSTREPRRLSELRYAGTGGRAVERRPAQLREGPGDRPLRPGNAGENTSPHAARHSRAWPRWRKPAKTGRRPRSI